ncbi:hypothetical protein Malapachy_0041 [Malassezia pachydermatis]|uniref:Uncharacterized protein n=1 Tax=Malassezia pachydermatis TaxID=77020 RepID=A0A0M8MKC5_9BASI|nr:hypothetical protein Malapachy_0041 [Malassezia pachydermatis]KOS13298.1 hypothetical protein Malapachy_0041 [Malassezia pachydermatis]
MPSKSASDTVFFEKSPTQDEDFLKHLSRKYMASTPLSSAGGLISYVFVKPPPKIQSISKNPSDTVDFSVAVTDTSPSS